MEEENNNNEISEEIDESFNFNESFNFFDNNGQNKTIYSNEEISEIPAEITESPSLKSAPEIIKTLVSQNLLSDNLDLETTLDKLPF